MRNRAKSLKRLLLSLITIAGLVALASPATAQVPDAVDPKLDVLNGGDAEADTGPSMDVEEDDAGTPMDAAQPDAAPSEDTGPEPDAAPGDDAGEPGDDAGEPGDDAGTPGDDAGTPGDDAGMPEDTGGNGGNGGNGGDKEDDGCGCNTASNSPSSLLFLLAGLFFIRLRNRRRA